MIAFILLFNGFGLIAKASEIEGTWAGKTIVTPSQYNSSNEKRAHDFLDHDVIIEPSKIFLPDQSICRLVPPITEFWQNDMRTFGSFGGNWSKIGLQQSSAGFEVIIWKLDCSRENERLMQIVSQPHNNILLLDFGRVFIVLQ